MYDIDTELSAASKDLMKMQRERLLRCPTNFTQEQKKTVLVDWYGEMPKAPKSAVHRSEHGTLVDMPEEPQEYVNLCHEYLVNWAPAPAPSGSERPGASTDMFERKRRVQQIRKLLEDSTQENSSSPGLICPNTHNIPNILGAQGPGPKPGARARGSGLGARGRDPELRAWGPGPRARVPVPVLGAQLRCCPCFSCPCVVWLLRMLLES